MNTVQINGETYEEIQRRRPKGGSKVSSLIIAAQFLSQMSYGNSYQRKLPREISICHEYELILNKKSNLSKWERDQVVRQFNLNYKKVTTHKHNEILH